MKKCCRCTKTLPLDSFSKNKSRSDGRNSWCRTCQQQYQKGWYARNKGTHIAAVSANNRRYRERNRAIVLDRLTECSECGEDNKIVLDFDHVNGDKVANVSDLVRDASTVAVLLEEIDKCEVVCANCHRIRTARRNPQHWSHKLP